MTTTSNRGDAIRETKDVVPSMSWEHPHSVRRKNHAPSWPSPSSAITKNHHQGSAAAPIIHQSDDGHENTGDEYHVSKNSSEKTVYMQLTGSSLEQNDKGRLGTGAGDAFATSKRRQDSGIPFTSVPAGFEDGEDDTISTMTGWESTVQTQITKPSTVAAIEEAVKEQASSEMDSATRAEASTDVRSMLSNDGSSNQPASDAAVKHVSVERKWSRVPKSRLFWLLLVGLLVILAIVVGVVVSNKNRSEHNDLGASGPTSLPTASPSTSITSPTPTMPSPTVSPPSSTASPGSTPLPTQGIQTSSPPVTLPTPEPTVSMTTTQSPLSTASTTVQPPSSVPGTTLFAEVTDPVGDADVIDFTGMIVSATQDLVVVNITFIGDPLDLDATIYWYGDTNDELTISECTFSGNGGCNLSWNRRRQRALGGVSFVFRNNHLQKSHIRGGRKRSRRLQTGAVDLYFTRNQMPDLERKQIWIQSNLSDGDRMPDADATPNYFTLS